MIQKKKETTKNKISRIHRKSQSKASQKRKEETKLKDVKTYEKKNRK